MNMNRLKRILSCFNPETVLFIAIALGWATAYYLEVSKLPHPETNMLFIRPCYFVILLCSIYLLVKEIRKLADALKKEKTAGSTAAPDLTPQQEKTGAIKRLVQLVDQHRAIVLLVLAFLYAGLLGVLGYLVSTALFLFVIFYVIGTLNRKPVKIVLLSIGITAVMYGTFGIFFQIALPKGTLF